MFGISDKRYNEMKKFCDDDALIEYLVNYYGVEIVEDGYIIKEAEDSEYIDGALYVSNLDRLGRFSSDFEAQRMAEKEGIKLINDIVGLKKGCYIDTPDNRYFCEKELFLQPYYRIENILDANDYWDKIYMDHYDFYPERYKNFTEKIISFDIEINKDRVINKTGFVYRQKDDAESIHLDMILLSGKEFHIDFPLSDLDSIRIEHLDNDSLYSALRSAGNSKLNLVLFDEYYQNKRDELLKSVKTSLDELSVEVKNLPPLSFMEKIEKLFNDCLPLKANDEFYSCVQLNVDDAVVIVEHQIKTPIEKAYDTLGFIDMDDAGSYIIYENSSIFNEYLERHCPDVIPGLKGKCSINNDGYIDSENNFVICTSYEIPVKYGETELSLEEIKKLFSSDGLDLNSYITKCEQKRVNDSICFEKIPDKDR